jgi:hypothetical protein
VTPGGARQPRRFRVAKVRIAVAVSPLNSPSVTTPVATVTVSPKREFEVTKVKVKVLVRPLFQTMVVGKPVPKELLMDWHATVAMKVAAYVPDLRVGSDDWHGPNTNLRELVTVCGVSSNPGEKVLVSVPGHVTSSVAALAGTAARPRSMPHNVNADVSNLVIFCSLPTGMVLVSGFTAAL